MNNTEIIAGIDMIIEGLSALKAAFSNADAAEPVAPKKSASKKKDIMPAPVSSDDEEEQDSATDKTTYTQAELVAMKYNDFKKLAASLGVDCRGTRDEIMKRVIATGIVSDAANEEAPAEKHSPVKKDDKKSGSHAKGGKLGARKAAKEERDEFDEQAEEIAKTTSYKDIVESLKEVGLKATKLNYKAQLAKALRENLLDVDSEDEGEDESGEEITASVYTPEYDLSGANDPGKMSDERSEAIQAKVGEILDAVSGEEISQDDIVDYLQSNASQEELDLLGDDYTEEDLLKLYIEVVKHFIDDEGDEHEPGEPYAVNEENFCCGQPLKYDKKTKRFLCEHCTSEYETE